MRDNHGQPAAVSISSHGADATPRSAFRLTDTPGRRVLAEKRAPALRAFHRILERKGGKIMTKRDGRPITLERARLLEVHQAREIQHYGTVSRLPIALDTTVCAAVSRI